MAELNKENAKYRSEFAGCTFANDDKTGFSRRKYGEFLANYLKGEKDGFVLNLNGSWGTGKTEFLKRLYNHFLDQNHPVLYINAWESDFSHDPLTVVSSELMTQLSKFNESIMESDTAKKVKSCLGKLLKGSAIVGTKIVAGHIFRDGTALDDFVEKLSDKDAETLINGLSANHQNQVDAIKDVRTELAKLSDELVSGYNAELPVIVLIDELDRCRPTYAIEMLEVIKHFFSTKNFVFLVATDTEQLCASIKAIYGNEFKSDTYLRRFFDRRVILPRINLKDFIHSNYQELFRLMNNIEMFPILCYNKDNKNKEKEYSFIVVLSSIMESLKLSLREVNSLIKIFIRIMNTIISNGKTNYICYPILLIELVKTHILLDKDSSLNIEMMIQNDKNVLKDLRLKNFLELCLKLISPDPNLTLDLGYPCYSPKGDDSKYSIPKSDNYSFPTHLSPLHDHLKKCLDDANNHKDISKYWFQPSLRKLVNMEFFNS
ncbi:P-loop NTPase fold protein [Celerinatantimonas sp. YJH-8]|uniref:KAP family P-loop NTPase fold protein n=1 Tax=Celerinatantimonas sp. YJH-8 TaxID=3228714 RepID=UPI0038CB0008